MTVKAASYSNDEQKIRANRIWLSFLYFKEKKTQFWCFLCIFTPCRCNVLESRWVSEPNWRRSKFLYRVWDLFFFSPSRPFVPDFWKDTKTQGWWQVLYLCLVSHFIFVLHLFLELLLMDMCLSLIQLLMAMMRSQAVRRTCFIVTAFFYSLLEIWPIFSDIWQKTKRW